MKWAEICNKYQDTCRTFLNHRPNVHSCLPVYLEKLNYFTFSQISIITLNKSLDLLPTNTALFTMLKTETEGNYIRINDYPITAEISHESVCDYDMIILGTCINLSCVYDTCSFIQIKPPFKHHCLRVVIGHVCCQGCCENAVEFKCVCLCVCVLGARQLLISPWCVWKLMRKHFNSLNTNVYQQIVTADWECRHRWEMRSLNIRMRFKAAISKILSKVNTHLLVCKCINKKCGKFVVLSYVNSRR